MGSVFTLIADEALVPEDSAYYTECQVCNRPGVPVYSAQGYGVDAAGGPDRAVDVYVACAECLRAGRVCHIDEYVTDPVIERFAADAPAEKALLRATPRCARFYNDTDWPLCCGALTEFVGEPTAEEAKVLDRCGQYWESGPAVSQTSAEDIFPVNPLGDYAVLAFRCRRCGKPSWVFQFG